MVMLVWSSRVIGEREREFTHTKGAVRSQNCQQDLLQPKILDLI